MQEVAKRGRGRPKGSRNKNKLLSGANVAQICEYHKFNPTIFLVGVADGTDDTEEWTKDDRLRAATKLHDSIHHNKAIGSLAREDQQDIEGQFEIVFIESPDDFSLPGTPDAKGATPVVQRESVQRASDTSQGWEDGICD